jgi:hypothetical protein
MYEIEACDKPKKLKYIAFPSNINYKKILLVKIIALYLSINFDQKCSPNFKYFFKKVNSGP